MAKSKIFFYVNLLLKITISIVFFIVFGSYFFQNFFELIGLYLGFAIPMGIHNITFFACFILWYLIIFCERTKEYQKLKNYYILNIIAEIILANIFYNLVLSGDPRSFNFFLFFFLATVIIAIMGLIYFLLKRKFYLHSEITAERMEKLKEILRVSNRIKLERVQNILNLNDKSFNVKIIKWANEFGFRLDGEYLIINQDTISDFIDRLDEQFAEWEEMEKDKINKI